MKYESFTEQLLLVVIMILILILYCLLLSAKCLIVHCSRGKMISWI